MGKQYEPSQQEIITAIDHTVTLWKTLPKENLIKGNFVCPLCNLIKTVYRVSFNKGSARGACVLCPIKHAGLFHICVGIQHVYSNSNITDNEMKALIKTVCASLKILKTSISNNDTYNAYTLNVLENRRSMIPGHKTGKISRTIKKEVVKPRRIFKATRK